MMDYLAKYHPIGLILPVTDCSKNSDRRHNSRQDCPQGLEWAARQKHGTIKIKRVVAI
jgi:hypothetical protein